MGTQGNTGLWGWATVISALVLVGLLLIFRSNPGWDIAVSTLFFEPRPCPAGSADWRVCGTFPLARDAFWDTVRDIGMTMPRLIMALTVLALLAVFVFSPQPDRKLAQSVSTGVLALFLGPLLITNWILKEFWGRARPFQTSEFGGTAEFSLPGSIVDECARNCSFVSGEAAAAFWLLWLVPLLPLAWRVWGAIGVFGFASFVAGLRVAFGRHFFSDVAIAAALSVTCICFSYWFYSSAFAQRRLDAFLNWGTRVAAPLHRRDTKAS